MNVNIEVVPAAPSFNRRSTDRRAPGHLKLLDPLLERRHLNRASFHPFFSDRRIPMTVHDLSDGEPAAALDASTLSTTLYGWRWAIWALIALALAAALRVSYHRDMWFPPVAMAADQNPNTDETPVSGPYRWSGYHRLAA